MDIIQLTNLTDKGEIKISIDINKEFEQLIKESQTLQFKLIVKRGNETSWDDLAIFGYSKDEKHYEYIDILVENNTSYEYCIKLVNSSITDTIDEQSIITSFKLN
ncbi:hypothetical protein [Clostridium sp.]|uniref:hypothetical protein n=1 Tax=Clostridium sp. TaxID=1506 RepID=UPI002625795E|nr:hypothetical protein [uncultured Clostridium sp.]